MSGLPYQSKQHSFSFKQTVSAFLAHDGLPFSEVLDANHIQTVFAKHNNLFGRTYTTAIVLWAFMGQVLRDGKEAACQSAVSRISCYYQLMFGHSVDPDTRDYCRARAKLSEEALHELSCDVARQAEEQMQTEHLFHGKHAKLIDGATVLMPDTPRNQAAYPQNPSQKPGIGFPIARMVAVISLATACVIDATMGKYAGKGTGETSLLRQLMHCLNPGDIAVADRNFGNFWTTALLMQRGVDICFRKKSGRPTDFRKGRRLGKNDHLVVWQRPPKPKWMSREDYDQLPSSIQLREIRYVLHQPGRKQTSFVLVTTLYESTEKQTIKLEELAELYGSRWNVEVDLRSIKTHMNMHYLRCKSPEMVHREIWTTLLAYNIIRTTIACASTLCGMNPRQISFVSACQIVLANWDLAASVSMSREQQIEIHKLKLIQISQCRIGTRPGRCEPRVLKKRLKNYPLMKQPRAELKQRLAKGDNSFE